jgi:predicted GNAT family acetyltransferase
MSEAFVERHRDDLCLTDDVTRLSVDTVARWLSNEAYWARGRSRGSIEKSIGNSHLYGVIGRDGEMIACARVVTDGATFAWICDVFVEDQRRGEGVGTWMVGELTDFWLGEGVARLVLATRDAHEVYAKVGFSPLAHPDRFMEVDRRAKF